MQLASSERDRHFKSQILVYAGPYFALYRKTVSNQLLRSGAAIRAAITNLENDLETK